jgi:hypothetical protein
MGEFLLFVPAILTYCRVIGMSPALMGADGAKPKGLKPEPLEVEVRRKGRNRTVPEERSLGLLKRMETSEATAHSAPVISCVFLPQRSA